MRKLLLILLCLFLVTGCKKGEIEIENNDIEINEIDINGTWILDEDKNDFAVFDDIDAYPGFSEWGAGMTVTDKDISLFIGALSYSGSYVKQNGFIHSEMTGDIDNSLNQWDFYIVDENTVEMRLSDMNLYWTRGEINAD